ncbi:hypothetical protein ACFSHR_15645 [Azotobacter chroococcum]
MHEGIWTLGNGLGVPLPANGFAYSAMPDAQPHRAARCHLHEGRGINENNVAVSTTNARRLNPRPWPPIRCWPRPVSRKR